MYPVNCSNSIKVDIYNRIAKRKKEKRKKQAKKKKELTSQIKCGNFILQITLWLSGAYAIFRDNEKSRSICIKFCIRICSQVQIFTD